jgi:hypothetical protein
MLRSSNIVTFLQHESNCFNAALQQSTVKGSYFPVSSKILPAWVEDSINSCA